MVPQDKDLRRKLAEADKEVKRIRFEEALAVPVCSRHGWCHITGYKICELHSWKCI